jgi:predicted AlkP superfamily phosphohydrolase/phosphomutase
MIEPRNIEPGLRPERTIAARKSLLKRFRDAVPMPLQYAVKSVLPEAIEKKLIIRFMGADDLNPEALAVYVPNNDLNSAVRINLKGRDKYGKVASGAEYDDLCAFLTARFAQLINPATGRPAVDTVTKVRDEFDGRYIDELPDLTIFWNNEHSIDAVHSPGYGTVVGSHSDPRSGGHTTKGFLIPPEGRSAGFELTDPDVKDLAPTVLSILDVPVPSEMEGRSLLRTSLNHSEVV